MPLLLLITVIFLQSLSIPFSPLKKIIPFLNIGTIITSIIITWQLWPVEQHTPILLCHAQRFTYLGWLLTDITALFSFMLLASAPQRTHTPLSTISIFTFLLGAKLLIASNHMVLMLVAVLCIMIAIIIQGILKNIHLRSFFIIYSVIILFMMMGAVFVFGHTGSMDLSTIAAQFSSNSLLLTMGMGFIWLSLLGLIAICPYHIWLIRLTSKLCTHFLLLIYCILPLSGLWVLIKLSMLKLFFINNQWTPIILGTASLGITLPIIAGIKESHLLKRIAYALSIHHGYILIGILTLSKNIVIGYQAIICQIIAMLFSNWAIIAIISKRSETYYINTISKETILTRMAFIVLFASMIGMPFTLGFWSRQLMLTHIISHAEIVPIVMGVISIIGSIVLIARPMIHSLQKLPMTTDQENTPLSYTVLSIIVISIALTILIGITPSQFLAFITSTRPVF